MSNFAFRLLWNLEFKNLLGPILRPSRGNLEENASNSINSTNVYAVTGQVPQRNLGYKTELDYMCRFLEASF